MRLAVVLAVLLLLAAHPAQAAAPGRLAVVATTTQMTDLVRVVGGDRVTVTGVLRPNVDPHDYEPTPSDARALAGARVVVVSGAGIDAWLEPLVRASGTRAAVVDASAGLPLRPGDPHWWLDPTLFARAATTVAAGLAAADPSGRAAYEANAARLRAALGRLDRRLRAEVAGVPVAERKIVTSHDSLAYLAAHYGLQVVGTAIPSLSSAAEPSARDVAHLIDRIRAEHVRAVFAESSVEPRLERQIARDSGAAVVGTLYGDTLGPPGSPGATYLGMLRFDVETIVAGLSGRLG